MIRILGLAVFVVVLFLLGYGYVNRSQSLVYANADSTIPLAYGTCRGAYGDRLLIFEDNHGTVRLVDPASGMVFGTVTRK
jgi:hypothetical protein